MRPLVSIIILNYNGGKVTETCLNSVLKSRYSNFEIILLDNNSEKKEIRWLKKHYGKKIKIVLSKENLGYAGGNNLSAENAKGKYLVFLNNDTVVPFDWLKKPIQRMEKDSKIAFLQPKIKWLKHKNFFEYAGGAGGYLDFFGYPFVRGRIFGSIEEDIGQYDDEREIFWASGVALFCRKNIFKKLGGFDSLFFAYAEENDLCFRAHRAGYKVIYCPGQEIFHLGGYTSNQNIFRKIFLIHRNHLILLIKNLRFVDLLLVLPLRLIMDIVSMPYYLYRFKSFKNIRAVISAYGSLILNFPKILKSRNRYQIKNFGYPQKPNLVYRGSIVWQYFIAKQKRWIEIIEKNSCSSKLIKIF